MFAALFLGRILTKIKHTQKFVLLLYYNTIYYLFTEQDRNGCIYVYTTVIDIIIDEYININIHRGLCSTIQ